MNYRRRLARSIFISSLIIVSAITYASYRRIRFWALGQLRENSFLEVQDKVHQIDKWFAFYKTKAITIARTPLVQTMDWQQMEAYLEREVDRLKPAANDATLCNPDGTYYFTGIGLVEGETVADRPYFKAAMAGQEIVVSEPIISRASGIPKINIAIPIGNVESPTGVSTLGIKVDSIREVINKISDVSGSYVFVLDAKGRAIVHPNPKLIFNQDQPEPPTLLAMAEDAANTEWVTVLQEMVDRQAGNELIKIDGQWQYVTYLPLQEANWSVALVTPREHIDTQLRSLDFIAVASGGLIVALLFALWLWQAQMTKNQALQLLQKNTAAANQKLEVQTAELSKTLLELKLAQSQLIQSEKMASIGQLVAGVAHEINNPVNFIHGNLTYAQEYVDSILNFVRLYQKYYPNPISEIEMVAREIDLEFLQNDLPKLLSSMEIGTDRIRKIVLSLRNFSRIEEAECKAVDIHEGIDSTLLLLKHRLQAKKYPQIEVIRNYGDLPLVECYAGQLNQVFMNILANAIDAIEEVNTERSYQEVQKTPNQIKISTSVVKQDWVEIAIADTGPGIAAEAQKRVFDPFFTTKPIGQGTGIGMSISYQIITQRHGGQLKCISTPGQGAQFIIQIPIQQQDPQQFNQSSLLFD